MWFDVVWVKATPEFQTGVENTRNSLAELKKEIPFQQWLKELFQWLKLPQ